MIKYVQQKNIDYNEIKKLLEKSEKSNQYTNMGPAKFELEKKIGEMLSLDDNKVVVCTSNGTLALHAIFLFLQKLYNKKFKLVSPSFTFPSCVVGGYNTDVVDIEMKNYTIPLTEENLNLYDGFIITNLFGTYPSNLLEWRQKCSEKNKILILDNASSPLSTINNTNTNNIADFSFGSLHHTKFLGFGEGGFAVIEKKHYEDFNRTLGFGFGTLSTKRVHSINSSNYKISDVAAAAIHQHLNSYDINKHIEVQNHFVNSIREIQEIEIFNYNKEVVYGNLPIVYKEPINHLYFKDKNIECGKYYYPLKQHKNSTYLYERIVNFPLHCDLQEYEIKTIISSIKRSINEYNNGCW